ncbi:hypothetical protein, partial [Sodalis sp.]|uniref:hypothetical protein n=1 Tax=Sodalis sp. (in: enterobacteria) TaxID=1898979 RepID=UPI003872E049
TNLQLSDGAIYTKKFTDPGVTVRCRSLAAATIVKRKPSAIFAARNAGKIGKNTSMPGVSGP